MSKVPIKFFSFLFLGILFFSSCQTADNREKTSEESHRIVTSFYPLAFLTQEIVGEKAEVIDLSGNQEVHDFQPSPQNMVTLQTADLVILQGAELEPWADDVLPQLNAKNIPVLEVSQSLKLQKMEETEQGHEENEEENHGEFDPHTWLDPVLAQNMVDVILAKVIEIDGKDADLFRQNAENLKKTLHEFDLQFQNLSCQNKEAIISHDAFGYLARRYGFTLHAIAGISTGDEPSAKLLAELKAEAEEGITHILTEENNVKRFAETLARETGLEMLPVFTLETDSEPFFSGYEKNLNALRTAFQCQ